MRPTNPAHGNRRITTAVTVLLLAVALFAWGALGLMPRQHTDGGGPGAAHGGSSDRPPADPAFAGGAGDPLAASITGLQQRLKTDPQDYVSWATLGMDYVQQAKAVIDPAYYPKAEGVLRRSLAINSTDNFVAMAGEAALSAARHDFTGALAWARRAAAIDPYNSTVYGIIGDADTQLGTYPQAYQAIQRMVDLEPGTPSLARASYTWELRGDLATANADMQRALADASTPADRAFAHYYLGELAFNAGNPSAALAQDLAGLYEDPRYAALLEGKAKAEAALGRDADAIRDYTAVVAEVPQPEYVLELGELYQSLGRIPAANQEYDLFRAEERLFEANGVTLDTDPTLFNADHGSPADALRYGQVGIKIRPFIEMDDAYAWALHRNGRDAEALVYSRKATALGMRNALFLYHRGMIELSLGQSPAARADLAEALKINPYFNVLQAPIARSTLARLSSTA